MPIRTLIQACLVMVGGLAWVGLPSEVMPSLAWRLHFGIAEMCFGAMIGFGIGLIVECRANGQQRKI